MNPKLEQAEPVDAGSGAKAVVPFTPLVELEHLLKVADSIAKDAGKTWAEIWSELRKVTAGTAVLPEAEEGFVPSCGWPEFLERLWLLKHYIDSIHRVCNKQSPAADWL